MSPLALVADIGGTHARFALVDEHASDLISPATLLVVEHASLEAAIDVYLASAATRPIVAAAIAMAGPVHEQGAALTNGSWGFDTGDLQHRLGIAKLLVLNDYEALALSLPMLAARDTVQIGGGAPRSGAPRVVMGPGTGFGGAVLLPGPEFRVLPGEIGHTSLPVRGQAEAHIAETLAEPDGHTPVENAVSGPGLLALYRQCASAAGHPPSARTAEGVVAHARQGDDPAAVRAVDLFVTWLGRVAGNAAMQLRAEGGVYLGGGMSPKMLDLCRDGRLRRAFEGMGRMTALVHPIPLFVITADAPALLGAAALLGRPVPGAGA